MNAVGQLYTRHGGVASVYPVGKETSAKELRVSRFRQTCCLYIGGIHMAPSWMSILVYWAVGVPSSKHYRGHCFSQGVAQSPINITTYHCCVYGAAFGHACLLLMKVEAPHGALVLAAHASFKPR